MVLGTLLARRRVRPFPGKPASREAPASKEITVPGKSLARRRSASARQSQPQARRQKIDRFVAPLLPMTYLIRNTSNIERCRSSPAPNPSFFPSMPARIRPARVSATCRRSAIRSRPARFMSDAEEFRLPSSNILPFRGVESESDYDKRSRLFNTVRAAISRLPSRRSGRSRYPEVDRRFAGFQHRGVPTCSRQNLRC